MTIRAVHSLIFAALAVIFLITNTIDWELEQSVLIKSLALLVLLVGVPHGAIDPLVARSIGIWKSRRGLVMFSLCYLATALVAVLCWINAPVFVLTMFIALSAWHFSEDWAQDLGQQHGLAISSSILTLPALFHFREVDQIFTVLTLTQAFTLTTSIAILAAPITLFAVHAAIKAFTKDKLDGIEIITLLISAAIIPPLWFFLLYFCFLHSPRHLIKSAMNFQHKQLLSTAVLFSILTALIALVTLSKLPEINLNDQLIQVIFVGLFALTVPHMILIELVKANSRDKNEIQQ